MAAISNARNKSPENADTTLIFSLEPLKTGDQFDAWPLHLTLQRWFSLPQHRQPFINAMANLAHDTEPIVITGGKEADFDEQGTTHVRRVLGSCALQMLHSKTTELITRFDGVPATRWSGEDYAPHVTFQNGKGLAEGEEIILTGLHLIRRDEKFHKTVEATFRLDKGVRSAPTARF